MTPAEMKDDVLQHHPDVTLIIRVFEHSSGTPIVGIDYFGVPQRLRGKGLGTRALQHLTTLADEHEFWLAATPTQLFGAHPQRLLNFLHEHGFQAVSDCRGMLQEYTFLRKNDYAPRPVRREVS